MSEGRDGSGGGVVTRSQCRISRLQVGSYLIIYGWAGLFIALFGSGLNSSQVAFALAQSGAQRTDRVQGVESPNFI